MRPTARELDAATLRGRTLFVDRRESARERGGRLCSRSRGRDRLDHIRAELGELAHRRRTRPRSSADELTVFRSLGLAVEDLLAAEYVVRRARETGAGTTIEF